MSKVNDVVSWIMKEDQILKLEKAGKTYDISDEVAKFLDGKGLFDKLEDQAVEVEIDESTASEDEAGSKGLITRLALSDGKAKSSPEPEKVEPKLDTAKDDGTVAKTDCQLVVKEMTVGGVSAKGGVKFKEDQENKTWYDLDSTINTQTFKEECTGKLVEVSIAPQEKGNDVIKGYVLMEEAEKEEEKETDEPKMNGKDAFYRVKQLENQVRYLKEEKAESFEAQASVNSASKTVSGMVNVDSKPDFVLRLIEKIAKHNFAIMQELKTKKE